MKIPIDLKTGDVLKETPKDIIVGIDLGTTNSLIAHMIDGQPITIKSEINKNALTPSVIYFDEDGKIVVGDRAKEKLITNPERTIFSVKRLLGKSYNDVQNLGANIGFTIIDTEGAEQVKVMVDGKFYSPILLSAEILKELKSKGEKHLGHSITKCVITVPAYFNDSQRQATRDAGKLAGLDVLRIINEPTAASLAYGIGLDKSTSSKIAVYDLGGGTFDISVLQIEDGIFDVLSTHGNTSLGGDDIDQAIMAFWQEDLKMDAIKLEDKAFSQGLRLAAEDAKKQLSYQTNFETTLDNYHLRIDIQQFESIIDPIIQKTILSCHQALKDAKLSVDQIDKVLLVGGSTRIPYIKYKLKEVFGQIPDDSLNPDEVVAMGAAIQADILAGNRKDLLLLDITPLSLGIETVGGLMDAIIPRNSKIPHRAGRNYTTSVDGQRNLRISVYQGERDLVKDNRQLGEFTLRNIPPMSAGIPKIEVQFVLDADGILIVKAKELRSGTETEVEIKSTYGISEEEMALMLIDSLKNADGDMKERAVLEAINEANNVILAADKFFVQNASILTLDELEASKKLNETLKVAVKSRDKDTIEAAMKSLNDYTMPLAHRALDANIGQALKETKI